MKKRPAKKAIQKQILQQCFREETKVSIDTVLELVTLKYNIHSMLLFSQTRKREIVVPRQIFLYLAYKYTRLSQEQIGAFAVTYGRLAPIDHATVIHASKTVENLMFWDKGLKADVDGLITNIKEYKNALIMHDVNLLKQAERNTERLKNIEVILN